MLFLFKNIYNYLFTLTLKNLDINFYMMKIEIACKLKKIFTDGVLYLRIKNINLIH